MRKFYHLLVLLVPFQLLSQISALPSPSAFLTTKYSDAVTNETTGKIVTGIPLMAYTVGKLEIPISLNYVGNGVKVVQPSNWVGTNWTVSAGGVVTRIVNSYPDEKASTRIFLEDLIAQGSSLTTTQYNPQPNEIRDFRADLFSFVFPGYSGSFYLDESWNAHLTDNNAELRINVLRVPVDPSAPLDNVTVTIIITTPTGIRYYFGGQNASEYSSTLVKIKQKGGNWMNSQNNEITLPVVPLAPTAFYLFKVENNYNDQVLLEYHQDPAKNFILFEQQERSVADGGVVVIPAGCIDVPDFNDLRSSIYHGTIYNPLKISKIRSVSSNLEVLFNSLPYTLPADGVLPTLQYDDRILNSIQLYDTQQQKNLRNFKLDYLLPSASNNLKYRFFFRKGINE